MYSDVINMEHRIMNFTVLIEQDEDGTYIAKVPDIPGCYTQGKTVEQAMKRVEEAVRVCIESDEEMDAFTPMKFIGLQNLEVRI